MAGKVIKALHTGISVRDMEEAVLGGENRMHLDLTADVMDIMTKTREEWGVVYPEEK